MSMASRRVRHRPLLLEPLEDRLLLSAALGASTSEPSPDRTPEVHLATGAHGHAADNDYAPAASSGQTTPTSAPSPTPAGQRQTAPVHTVPLSPVASPTAQATTAIDQTASLNENEDSAEYASHGRRENSEAHFGGGRDEDSLAAHFEPHLHDVRSRDGAATVRAAVPASALLTSGPLPAPAATVSPIPSFRQPAIEQPWDLLVDRTPEALRIVQEADGPAPAVVSSEAAERSPREKAWPLAGVAPLDLRQLEQGVDAFFEQLDQLDQSWPHSRLYLALAPWLIVSTAVACELAFWPIRRGYGAMVETEGGDDLDELLGPREAQDV